MQRFLAGKFVVAVTDAGNHFKRDTKFRDHWNNKYLGSTAVFNPKNTTRTRKTQDGIRGTTIEGVTEEQFAKHLYHTPNVMLVI